MRCGSARDAACATDAGALTRAGAVVITTLEFLRVVLFPSIFFLLDPPLPPAEEEGGSLRDAMCDYTTGGITRADGQTVSGYQRRRAVCTYKQPRPRVCTFDGDRQGGSETKVEEKTTFFLRRNLRSGRVDFVLFFCFCTCLVVCEEPQSGALALA